MDVRAFFGCDIVFGTTADEIVYSRSVADIPIIAADPYLNSLLLKYCDEAVASRRRKSSTWQMRVENAIAPLLPHGEARIEEICRKLGVSRRTLMRRLASEQQTISKVLRDLRVKLAKRYLREPGVPISEVAWLLGYANASAFNHAFKRWTGVSPSDARS